MFAFGHIHRSTNDLLSSFLIVALISILASTRSGYCFNETIVEPLTVCSISDDGDRWNVLVKLPSLPWLLGKDLLSASLVFDIDPGLLDSMCVLESCPISRIWDSENVSWYSPWSSPGGDHMNKYCGRATFLPRVRRGDNVVIDMTQYFGAISDGDIYNYGLLVKGSGGSGICLCPSVISSLTTSDVHILIRSYSQ